LIATGSLRATTSFVLKISYKVGFYDPTILKVHPPISWITAHAAMPGRLEHLISLFAQGFLIQMNGA